MNSLQTSRLLDEQMDRSQMRIEPAEAAKYQFIWDFSSTSRLRKSTTETNINTQQPREDDERTLTSVCRGSRREKKGIQTGGQKERLLDRSINTMQQVYFRSIRAPTTK